MGCSKTYRNWECLNFFKPFSGFGPLSRQPWHNQEYLIFISNIFFCNLDHFHFCDQDNQEYLIFISNIFSGTCSTSSCVSKTAMNILFSFQIFFFWNLLHFQLCEQDNHEYPISISNILSGTCSTSSCVGETKLRRKCRTRFWLLTNSGATSVPWLTSATKIKYNWNIMRNIIHHLPKIFHKKNILWYNYNHYPEMPLK